jgi:hypothetical protein
MPAAGDAEKSSTRPQRAGLTRPPGRARGRPGTPATGPLPLERLPGRLLFASRRLFALFCLGRLRELRPSRGSPARHTATEGHRGGTCDESHSPVLTPLPCLRKLHQRGSNRYRSRPCIRTTRQVCSAAPSGRSPLTSRATLRRPTHRGVCRLLSCEGHRDPSRPPPNVVAPRGGEAGGAGAGAAAKGRSAQASPVLAGP